MPSWGFLGWIIFGGIAGWIASKIMKTDASMGIVMNIIVGIVGVGERAQQRTFLRVM